MRSLYVTWVGAANKRSRADADEYKASELLYVNLP